MGNFARQPAYRKAEICMLGRDRLPFLFLGGKLAVGFGCAGGFWRCYGVLALQTHFLLSLIKATTSVDSGSTLQELHRNCLGSRLLLSLE